MTWPSRLQIHVILDPLAPSARVRSLEPLITTMLSPLHHQQHHLHHYASQQPYAPTTSTPSTASIPSETPNYYYFADNSINNTTVYAHPAPTNSYSPSKRLKLANEDYFTHLPSSFDCPPLAYSTMPQAVHRPRPLAPHISLHRPSEPASPVTVASTLSNHSTPSPSPHRVTILDNNTPADFTLFEDCYPHPEQKQANHPRYVANTSNPSHSAAVQYNGTFGGLDQSYSNYVPQPMDYKMQQQQQQFYQHNMSPYGVNNHHHSDDEELPALSPSRGAASRPSISEIDMPATPVSPLSRDGTRCTHTPTNRESLFLLSCLDDYLPGYLEPKLSRTISDAVQDELFNPGIAPGTAHSQSTHLPDNSQLPTLFQQAQSQHAMARTTPVKPVLGIRNHSPFRANSPFHPARTHQEIGSPPTRNTAFLNSATYNTSARARREKDIECEAQALRERMKKDYEEMQQTPKTISPKDAYLEYNEPEGNGVQGSLFSGSQTTYTDTTDVKSESDHGSYHGSAHGDDETVYDSMSTSRRESDVSMDYGMPTYNNAQQFGHHLSVPYGWDESSSQESSGTSRPSDDSYGYAAANLHRPEYTMANDGAYSCTVHGCSQRFSTASKMSKHRREAHRHSTPMGRDAPTKSLLQGPSRCARINPTTGKPCNTIFSRPYDLTRHEDTIHNTARQKVRCELCNDDKTFSRQDALTRHKKVSSLRRKIPP